MPRPLWEGHLKLSLVTCAVSLYTATTRARDISFHLLHKDTMNRIRMIPTDPEIGPVERSDLVKGYEVEKDQYIVLDKEDFESVRLEATKTIEIDRFVAGSSLSAAIAIWAIASSVDIGSDGGAAVPAPAISA